MPRAGAISWVPARAAIAAGTLATRERPGYSLGTLGIRPESVTAIVRECRGRAGDAGTALAQGLATLRRKSPIERTIARVCVQGVCVCHHPQRTR